MPSNTPITDAVGLKGGRALDQLKKLKPLPPRDREAARVDKIKALQDQIAGNKRNA